MSLISLETTYVWMWILIPLSIIDDTVICDYFDFKDISCQKHLITFSSFSLPSFSLHLEDICHVCRPVFECAYKVYEIKTGRPCSTQWFKEHLNIIISFFAWQSAHFLDYTTWRLKIRHIAAFVTKYIGAKLLADFSSICIISLSKRI